MSSKTQVLTTSHTASTIDTRALLHHLVRTDGGAALTVLRLALAAVLWPHGAQKVLGWFGGHGLEGTMGFMTGIGIPAPLAALAIAVEFLAPLALVFGIGGRVAAVGIIGLMVGAARLHLANGFFMNWSGSLPAGGEGFEFHVLAIGMAAAVAIAGSGALSLDRRLARATGR
jgi:putative oxidoreductase